MPDDILILEQPIRPGDLRALVADGFGDMVKFVVDVERGVVAIGGQLHAEGEHRLLNEGSSQEDLWGANYFPGRGREGCLEYTSLINIRPARNNPGMEVEDAGIRERIRELAFRLIGEGQGLDHGPA